MISIQITMLFFFQSVTKFRSISICADVTHTYTLTHTRNNNPGGGRRINQLKSGIGPKVQRKIERDVFTWLAGDCLAKQRASAGFLCSGPARGGFSLLFQSGGGVVVAPLFPFFFLILPFPYIGTYRESYMLVGRLDRLYTLLPLFRE